MDGPRPTRNGRGLNHAFLESRANRDAVVCFEATDGQEWQLWETLGAEDVDARQVLARSGEGMRTKPSGTRARTDRLDAELIARFLAC